MIDESEKSEAISQSIVSSDIVCLIVIADRENRHKLLDALNEGGGRLINVEFAFGSANVSSLSEMFGFTPDDKKVVITCLMKRENSETLLERLREEFDFDKPNTGIAFTIPLDKLSF